MAVFHHVVGVVERSHDTADGLGAFYASAESACTHSGTGACVVYDTAYRFAFHFGVHRAFLDYGAEVGRADYTAIRAAAVTAAIDMNIAYDTAAHLIDEQAASFFYVIIHGIHEHDVANGAGRRKLVGCRRT
jgi:hypothetical protein